jgi:hypothetical protein
MHSAFFTGLSCTLVTFLVRLLRDSREEFVSQGKFPQPTVLVQVVNGLEPPLDYDLVDTGVKSQGPISSM